MGSMLSKLWAAHTCPLSSGHSQGGWLTWMGQGLVKERETKVEKINVQWRSSLGMEVLLENRIG